MASGKTVHEWVPSGSLTFSPDGKALAASLGDRVVFSDPTDGARIREFPSAPGRVTYRPDGRVVAVSGPEAVELRDALTGREISRLPHGPGEAEERNVRMFGHEGSDLAFSPDGRFLVVATNPPRVWDVNTGNPLFTLNGHDGSVPGVTISPDGRQVATAGVDSTIRFWSMQTGAEQGVLRGHSAWAGCLAYHPEGWSLLSGGRHIAEVKAWDLTRRQEYLSMPGVRGSAVVFHRDGRNLDILTVDGGLQRREVETNRIVMGPHIDLSRKWQTPAVLAEFSSDGRRLSTVASNRRIIKLRDPEDGRETAVLEGLTVDANCLAFSGDGNRVVALGAVRYKDKVERDVIVWDAVSAKTLSVFHPTPGPTINTHGRVALDHDGARVAFDDYEEAEIDSETHLPLGAPRSYINVCGASTSRLLQRLRLPGALVVYAIAFSPNGRLIAAGDREKKVWIWDAHTGVLLHETQWDGESFRLAFSPDG